LDDLDELTRVAHAERGRLAALARAEGATAEDAVDCVQEAFSTLLARTRNGDAPARSEEWGPILAGTVRNLARNRRRRHFRLKPHDDIDAHELGDDGRSADQLIARAEEHVRLRACVEDLCEIQKAVVTLRLLEERPGEDVARALGISAGYVAVLLHRAKAALRECMT
jgi:RNA polymerase sigma-70 factor (ECF subfamily)